MLQGLPRKSLSRLVGRFSQLQLPDPFRIWQLQIFARLYGINTEEAEFPLSSYLNLREFFTRRLKPGTRPISPALVVHPADSEVLQAGGIRQSTLVQAKGISYSVASLLGDSFFLETKHSTNDESHPSEITKWTDGFRDGFFCNYYLCPTDYHRVHCGFGGILREVRVLPGDLWPVNRQSVESVSGLYGSNERVVGFFDIPLPNGSTGTAAMVMVGATNVGEISLASLPNVRTNQSKSMNDQPMRLSQLNLSVNKGDEFGTFFLGSTVILLLSKDVVVATSDKEATASVNELPTHALLQALGANWIDRKVRLGEALF